ncbi:efflux RND transporter periplasmic adaptor subunit [Methylomonas sp. AM2-LC]|uniref:efflux RND transporter periplasmic adaptor subunit n=1 Tax=Methylomonas sp. AM2-LC TaxID=3153301 RepID=UPI003265784F
MTKLKQTLVPILLGVFLIFLLIASGFWLFQFAGKSQPPLQTIVPGRMSIVQKTTATGQIVARRKIKIKSQANGILDEISVQPGQWLRTGDFIARIRLRADPVEVNTAQSQINKASLEHQRASLELQRRNQLHEQKLISDAAFQDDQLKFDVTRAALEQAQRDLELRLKGASQQLKTTSTLIAATMDGMVLEKPVEIGDFIIKTNDLNEGTTIVTLADMNNLMFKGEVEEAEAGRLKIGMPLKVQVGALQNMTLMGTLDFIAPEAKKSDQGRITFEIRASLQARDDALLRAGFSATAEIVFTRHDNVLSIPESHLLFNKEQPYVHIEVEPGKSEQRKIEVGLSDGINIEIIYGLNEGDHVVTPENQGHL